LHSLALILVVLARLEDLLKLSHSLLRCHLQRFDLVTLILEGAIEAENHVSARAVSLIILMLAGDQSAASGRLGSFHYCFKRC
jgi:hypothetical protein